MTRFAILADIHGNSWALEAALDDVARRGVEQKINLGDMFFGSLDLAGTVRLLRRPAHRRLLDRAVSGNQDDALITEDAEHSSATEAS